ncbi:MAG: hypothetical protein HC786_23355 [Richelia sp. CSU_2_1]|nr:hypothetical protein [Microcoleus sp. SU_5_6]NJL68806.1 hypothetical protein [Microcoleus sp. SM1_3_4]NJR24885.1 hypothetical protein [Richelia sp. CSU_2_1]
MFVSELFGQFKLKGTIISICQLAIGVKQASRSSVTNYTLDRECLAGFTIGSLVV